MNRSIRVAVAMAAVLLVASAAAAAVKPNPLFSDGAVLQRDVKAPVWGTAGDGEKVSVSICGRTASTVAEGGKWMVKLPPMKAGGPFTMTISGENTIEVNDVLVGEVWVCSGQSNMAMALKGCEGSAKTIANSADPRLRLLTVPRLTADRPQSEVNVSWAQCSPVTARTFSAVGYYFGRDLRKALGVPVGLIHSSWGGTPAQAWTPVEAYAYDRLIAPIPTWPKTGKAHGQPSALYNAMIAPLQPYAIKGVIWYQGEANANGAYTYRTLFPAMIRGWRQTWGQGDFPFLFVQLAPYMKIVSEPGESPWAELREAQFLTSRRCKNTAMAVITDCGNPDNIHPTRKAPVGARLALAARTIAYNEKLVYRGPTYRGFKLTGDGITVSFDSVGGGLVARGLNLTGWAIAGEDHKFVNAEARIVGDSVFVRSPSVPNPVAVRYGWANCPVVNLFNAEGLPASPFRTDDFAMVTRRK